MKININEKEFYFKSYDIARIVGNLTISGKITKLFGKLGVEPAKKSKNTHGGVTYIWSLDQINEPFYKLLIEKNS